MIKYSGNTINDWWRSSSAITKVMYNGNQAYRRKVRVLPMRWAISVTSFVCDNDNRYEKQIKQYSLDDGLTWENYTPEISRKGSLFESSSTVCISGTQSPMYAVTEQITGYSGSFHYVFETSSNNWYQRENNQYVIYDGDYVRLIPEDNLEFSSISQASAYEGVWYGQSASISGTDYMFCETNEYMAKTVYQEVAGDYICRQGNKYKKMQQMTRNVDGTLSSTGVYVPGDLIESGSTDCQVSDFCYSYTVNGETTTVDCETETFIPHERFHSVNIDSAEVGSCCQSIGAYAFDSCPLTSLTINDGVTDIDHEAFQDAGNLTTLTIPSTVTGSSFWVFARMTACTEVIFECSAPPTNTAGWGAQFHDWYPPVVYVPDAALSTFRNAGFDYWIDGTNPPASIDDWIRPISER